MKNNTTNFQIFFIPVITVFLFLIVSCTPYYIASNFNSRTIKHTKVAVLPFEILFIAGCLLILRKKSLITLSEDQQRNFRTGLENSPAGNLLMKLCV